MSYVYNTVSHTEKMHTLFPNWVRYFETTVWDSWLTIWINEWSHENKWWFEITLNYDKSFFPEEITNKLDANIEHFMSCKIWVFFDWTNIIFSSIQWQSFTDKLAQLFITLNIDNSTVKSKEELSQLIKDYWEQKDQIIKKIVKILWMPSHDFLFLLGSLVGVALWWKQVRFIKKHRSNSVYLKQTSSWNKKLLDKFPYLSEEDEFIYWDEDKIIEYISTMPTKQQELLFLFFDSLTTYKNKFWKKPIEDLNNSTKWKLIWTIRSNRRRL